MADATIYQEVLESEKKLEMILERHLNLNGMELKSNWKLFNYLI